MSATETVGTRASVADWLGSPILAAVVTRVARHYRLGCADIDDLIQETRIALWGMGLEVEINVSWINRTAIHKAVDLLRATARRQAREAVAAELARTPRDAIECRHLLNAQLDALARPLRRLYEMHYREGRSEREIARERGLCRASVRWLDTRLRRSVGAGH